jgi:hypothetical protein
VFTFTKRHLRPAGTSTEDGPDVGEAFIVQTSLPFKSGQQNFCDRDERLDVVAHLKIGKIFRERQIASLRAVSGFNSSLVSMNPPFTAPVRGNGQRE